MTPHILIVEDEPKIGRLIKKYLESESYEATHIEDGGKFEDAFAALHPDLIILDIQLPGKNGLDICRDLRSSGNNTPVIMVTARIDEIDRLIGLDLGADDYICKPFSPKEVVARVRAVLRRLELVKKEDVSIKIGSLLLDKESRQVFIEGNEIELTPLEYDIILTFTTSPKRVYSRSQLIQICKGTDYPGYERNMDTHIKNVRKKLKKHLSNEDPFQSIYSVGYRLNIDAFSA